MTIAYKTVHRAVKDVNDQQMMSDSEAARQSRHDRLLKSLKYPTMNERRNQIKEPHFQTFEWIFNDPDVSEDSGDSAEGEERKTREDDKDDDIFDKYERAKHEARVRDASRHFCQWLRSRDASLFWICGKPGSGKSTLMMFLTDHPKTLEILNQRKISSRHDLMISSHFIWSSGLPMEAKIKGCLCTLVYQLIHSSSENSHAVLQKFPLAKAKIPPQTGPRRN